MKKRTLYFYEHLLRMDRLTKRILQFSRLRQTKLKLVSKVRIDMSQDGTIKKEYIILKNKLRMFKGYQQTGEETVKMKR